MEFYTETSRQMSRLLTNKYSTSFSLSSRLFNLSVRTHIYAIYGLVRVADEIVDSYPGSNKRDLLDKLYADVLSAIRSGFSPNPVVHAFAVTAASYCINQDLIEPFFKSMKMDIDKSTYDKKEYEEYVYGSAEVVGLMCLRVFTNNDQAEYERLRPGAQALGSAYQKVNFLRDMQADYTTLGRVYFPAIDYDTFSEQDKTAIIRDIEADFERAESAAQELPPSARKAVRASMMYYRRLLRAMANASVEDIRRQRYRVPDTYKILLLVRVSAGL